MTPFSWRRWVSINCFSIFFAIATTLTADAELPKKYSSPVLTKETPGHRIDNIEIDIRGAKRLLLEVTKGGDDTSYDWADWIEPTLVGPQGAKKLTELKWTSVTKAARINQSQGGGPLKVGGKAIEFGIGTHAESVITYQLPKGYTTFRTSIGLDNGGTDQKGSRSSVQFHIFKSEAKRS